MRISIFGAGYVGLVTAACFAELGNEVICCDVDAARIERLERGETPFYEPGLPEIAARNLKDGRLRFTTDAVSATLAAEMLFVAVGTPPKEGNGEPDLRYVRAVAETIGANLETDRAVVVIKSTVPVGTHKEIQEIIAKGLNARGKKIEFAVAANPEFLKEGDAVNDFMRPDRVVVGVRESWAKEKMAELYAAFVKNGLVLFMDPASATMSKYAANLLLAARISLMNELSTMAEVFGADIEQVRLAAAADARLGKHFLYPGVGYGGSCFPKDVQALAVSARTAGLEPVLTEAVEQVNNAQRERFVVKIIEKLAPLKGKRLAVWGLAFKPKTDDMRQAPAIHIVDGLLKEGAEIVAYDPVAMGTARQIFGERVSYADDMYSALEGAAGLVLITEWSQFREPDFEKIGALIKSKVIFDGRNIYDPARLRELGFTYYGIGRQGKN